MTYLAHVKSSIRLGDVADLQHPIASVRLSQTDSVISSDDFVVDRQNGMSVYSDPGHLDNNTTMFLFRSLKYVHYNASLYCGKRIKRDYGS